MTAPAPAPVANTLRAPADIIAIPTLDARRGRTGWIGKCPNHDDRARSLSLRLGDDGRLLVNCFAGCRTTAVVAALGLELRDLFPRDGDRPRPRRATRTSVAVSPLDQARTEILREGRRQQARLAPYRALFIEADRIRVGFQLVARARQVATQIGDREVAWLLLSDAADVERDTLTTEAELNQLLAEKRLPS